MQIIASLDGKEKGFTAIVERFLEGGGGNVAR